MRRFFAIFSALLITFWNAGCAYAFSSSTTPHPTVSEEYMRTVRIAVLCPDGSISGGSGVRIGGTVVLTAFHVIDCDGEPATAVVIRTDKGDVYPAEVAAEIRDQDVARLNVTGLPELPQVTIGRPVLGQRACATFALPEVGRRCGEIWPPYAEPPGDMHLDFVGEHGNSGSAVWDEDGRLIGILVHLHWCLGTEVQQVCTAGATTIWPIRWIARV